MKKFILIGIVIAMLGTLVTGYLSYEKLTDQTPVCPIGSSTGCAIAAQSSYAEFGAIPVAMIGLLTWIALLWLGLAIYKKYSANEDFTSPAWAMFILASIGIAAAGYFNSIMLFKLNVFCFWCETAHSLMLGKFFLSGYLALGKKQKWVLKTGAFAVALFAVPFVFAASTGASASALHTASVLHEYNVTMYGAYWCPHCKEQKELFGDAFSSVDYVECALPNGGQTAICQSENITGYPTWVRSDGVRVSGTKSLAFLEKWAIDAT